MKKFVEFMQAKLAPFGAKIANQRHLQAISGGLALLVPLTLVGAIFNIISTQPLSIELAEQSGIFSGFLKGWISLATNYGDVLKVPYNMTMNLFGLLASFTIAYRLSTSYKMSAVLNGLVSFCLFFMVAGPMTTGVLSSTLATGKDTATSIIPTSGLGTAGLFTAMLVAIISVEITRLCNNKGIKISFPDSVPPIVAQSFSTVIPLLINIIVIYGSNVLLLKTTGLNLVTGLTKVLSPGLQGVNTPLGMSFLVGFGMFLWFFGIHGMAIVYPIIMPLSMQLITENAEIVAAGGTAIYHPVHAFGLALIGGSGATLGLAFLMLKSKSVQMKVLAKASLIPALFSINEPIIFGAPLMLNPIMLIPFVFAPIVNVLLGILAGNLGLIGGYQVYVKAYLPNGFSAFLSTLDIRNFIICWILVIVSALIYYPFFKVYEKQLLDQENAQEKSAS